MADRPDRDRQQGAKRGWQRKVAALEAAEKRIGYTIQDRLRWLLAFRDMDATRPGPTKAGWEVLAFSERAGSISDQSPPITPLVFPRGPRPRKEVQALQAELRDALNNYSERPVR
jgi:hypothetical protein